MRRVLPYALFALVACGDGDALPRAGTLERVEEAPPPAPPDQTSGSGATARPLDEDPTPLGPSDSMLEEAGEQQSEPDAALQPQFDAGLPLVGPQSMDGGEALDAGPSVEGGGDAPLDAGHDTGTSEPDAASDTGTDATDGVVDGDVGVAALTPYAQALLNLLARMRECNALGAGEHNRRQVVDDRGLCVVNCIIAAPCADVRHHFCSEEAPSIDDCHSECPVAPVTQAFDCGDGQQAWLGFACDGRRDCANGRDEQGCPMQVCADGEVVTGPTRCDGRARCRDRSDELGCASTCLAPSE